MAKKKVHNLKTIEDMCRIVTEENYVRLVMDMADCIGFHIKLKRNDSAFKDYTTGSNRAPDDVNFTNVWSFMPQNKTSHNDDLNNVKHPTVKPILLINRLIALVSRENEIVYDGFMGSGTTAISCIEMNRKFVGSELHKEYFDIATKRIEDESSKLSLFAVS